jgi:hypothetical protein
MLSKNLKIGIYKTIILPVVLYECETWSLTLREELRLGVFENKVLRRIFGSKRDEVTGEWRKLHNVFPYPQVYRSVQNLLSSRMLSKNLKNWNIQDCNVASGYGCETWSLTLREELRLGVFENRVLRRIFGSKRDEVTG